MSLITPIPQNTIIHFYNGINWRNDYKDIRWFKNETERSNFLNSRLQRTTTNCSIQRIGKSITVEGKINDFLTYNYLDFTNQSVGSTKTMYAFITSVDYVNVNAVTISFEIDWIQSYLFQFNIRQCFVEREHVLNDVIGDYILDEGLDYGEYVIDTIHHQTYDRAVCIQFLANNPYVELNSGLVTCLNTKGYDMTELTQITGWLTEFNDTPERIVLLCMAVNRMFDVANLPQFMQDLFSVSRGSSFYDADETRTSTGYVPENKKLYTYPYRLLTLDNYSGDVEQYRWELFANHTTAQFRVQGTAIPRPVMHCYPVRYRENSSSATYNQDQQEGVIYDNFPAVPFATDTYKAWVSQYGVSKAVSVGASVVATVVGVAGAAIATGGVAATVAGVAGATNIAQTVTNAVTEQRVHKIHSQQMRGGVSDSGMAYARSQIGFRISSYAISRQDAKRIDRYFMRYGYRVDETKIPEYQSRRYVNYVKTKGAVVTGNAPDEALNCLAEAMNNGVSFWHTNGIGTLITTNPVGS